MAAKRRRSREDTRKLVRKYEKSGLSHSNFCCQRKIRPQHLRRWTKREESDSPQPKLVEVKVKRRKPKSSEGGRSRQIGILFQTADSSVLRSKSILKVLFDLLKSSSGRAEHSTLDENLPRLWRD